MHGKNTKISSIKNCYMNFPSCIPFSSLQISTNALVGVTFAMQMAFVKILKGRFHVPASLASLATGFFVKVTELIRFL